MEYNAINKQKKNENNTKQIQRKFKKSPRAKFVHKNTKMSQ